MTDKALKHSQKRGRDTPTSSVPEPRVALTVTYRSASQRCHIQRSGRQ